MREQVSFDRDELAVILKEHLNLDDAVETRVNYGNAGFTLYLENYEPPTHDEIMSTDWFVCEDDWVTFVRIKIWRLQDGVRSYNMDGKWLNVSDFIGKKSFKEGE